LILFLFYYLKNRYDIQYFFLVKWKLLIKKKKKKKKTNFFLFFFVNINNKLWLWKIVTGGKTGKTTRYWDCCLASCSWKENTKASHPVNACSKDGRTVFSKFDWTIGSACSKSKGYMCSNNQPWAVNDNVAYGFVAADFNGGSQKDWCCTCQRLEFTSGPIAGK